VVTILRRFPLSLPLVLCASGWIAVSYDLLAGLLGSNRTLRVLTDTPDDAP